MISTKLTDGSIPQSDQEDAFYNETPDLHERSQNVVPDCKTKFDLENTRRDLIAMRNRHGARSRKGIAASTAVEQIEELHTNWKPQSWMAMPQQTLPYMLGQTMKILAS